MYVGVNKYVICSILYATTGSLNTVKDDIYI